MCLQLPDASIDTPAIASEDIPVYRVLYSAKAYQNMLRKQLELEWGKDLEDEENSAYLNSINSLDVERYPWVSPYYKAPISLDEIQVSDLHYPMELFNLHVILVGIHSVATLEDARALVAAMVAENRLIDGSDHSNDLAIFEAVIPEGSLSYKGLFHYVGGDAGAVSYASNQIKYIKRID